MTGLPLSTPFTIDVAEETLGDMERRLANARLPDEYPDAGWDYGFSVEFMERLVRYWREEFDWRACERRLNAFPAYRIGIEDLGVHFVHVRGKGPSPLPLLMLHGWPSTFAEFLGVIEPLTDPAAHGGDPADAFDVVIPSLPGVGFSDRPRRPGTNVRRIAEIFRQLMVDHLGYQRFGVQGGDWGSVIANWMGYAHPTNVAGLALTQVLGRRVGDAPRDRRPRPAFSHGLLNRHTPQTMSFALNDSPVGLAAWIVEKHRSWGDPGIDGQSFEDVYGMDYLLTTVMIYWLTQTTASAARLYHEDFHAPTHVPKGDRITVPTGFLLARLADDTYPRRDEQEHNYADIRRWVQLPRRGHFTSVEQPEMLIGETRELFRMLRPTG